MNEHNIRIKTLAQKTLKIIDCQKPPVPVERIAEKIGLRIEYFPLDKRISGILKKNKKIIGVNQNHHPLRQRFSIAHELGHYLLEHEIDANAEDIVDENFNWNTHLEREANLFASFLLMPEEWIKELTNGKTLDIEKLSQKFQVSEQAMTIRLLELNLIK
jgi:Zn-dependent peptidase ImmA (M78 family)